MIALIFSIVCGIARMYRSTIDAGIVTREQTAPARIVEYPCGDADCLKYVFSVNGKTYEGEFDPLRADNFPAAPLAGKYVMIFFDPDDPSTNSDTHFANRSKSGQRNAIFLFSISLVLAVMWIIFGPVATMLGRQRVFDRSEQAQ